ncbi:MFS transporter [Motilibacter deserti]|uniref:MFS transporter n=1 Tax=Motilibacter deserti TaxID=2714956 RepID=A0ABX0GYT4_9ACTN|nr:MFS transporter [Motilibacter deserti]NHC16099.1 MFS transporter [Motilibacter deserti]
MPRPGSFVGDLVDVLEGPRFRKLYATRLCAQAADGATTVALTSFVFFSPERQATAGDVATAFAVTLLPYSLVGPFAGVLLDRWRRRQILVVASLLKALLVLVLAALVAVDYAGAGFYAVGLLVLSVNRFYLSALSAALPHVVPERELVMANSVSTTSGTVSSLLGAALAFGIRAVLGEGTAATAGILAASALTSLGASALATRMHRDLLGPDLDGPPPHLKEALQGVASGMTAGAHHIRVRRAARRALTAIAAHRLVYGLWTVSTLLLYRNTLNDPDDTDAAIAGLATVVGASGVGYFLAALATPEVTAHARKSTWVTALLSLAGLTQLALLALPVDERTVVGSALLLGLAAQGVKICVDTMVQEAVSDDFRGRVFSVYDTLFNVCFVSAAAFAAVAVPSSGKSPVLTAALGGGYLLAAGWYASVTRRRPEPAEGPIAGVSPAPPAARGTT